jgi:hypothetical protein
MVTLSALTPRPPLPWKGEGVPRSGGGEGMARTRPGRPRAGVLLAGALLALAALCAWGTWLAAQPELNTFLLLGAYDIRREPVGPGMESLRYSHDGAVVAQSLRLYAAVERRGWQISQPLPPEECDGPCLLGQVTLIFTRTSLFGRVKEVVSVEQRGVRPYQVRVVLRRCVQLPVLGCWPPG